MTRAGWILGGLLTGVLVLGLPGSTAVADSGSCPGGEACLLVTVTGSIQLQQVVTGQDLDDWTDMPGPDGPPYRTHSPGLTRNDPRPSQATSVPSILDHLVPKVPVPSVTFVTARASGNAHPTRLGPADLTRPGGDTGFQGNVVPGFWSDSDRELVRFARPMRSDDDLNYQDVWTTLAGGTATLVVHTTGRIIHPQIQPSTTKTAAGTSVGFGATFADSPQPTGPTYTWSFGDGTTSTKPTPSHTWKKTGTFVVTLDAGAADGSEGTATPVRVQVGPKPDPTPTAPPTKQPTAPGTGTGGVHNPVTGPNTGTGSTSNGSTTPRSGLAGTGGTTPGAGQSGPAPSTPSTPSTPSQVPGTGNQSLPVGTPVSGILLVADATASSPTASKAAPVSAAAARAVRSLGWDRGLLWLLVLPALLALGGLTQTRWFTRRLPVLPWRTP